MADRDKTERRQGETPGSEPAPGNELIFGRNAVLSFLEQALDAADSEPASGAMGGSIKINKILIAQGGRPDVRLEKIHELARAQKVPLIACDRRKLDQLAGSDQRHQGVVALISPVEMWQFDLFLDRIEGDRARREESGLSMDGYTLALLDGIEDPHNLGAIVRTAEAAGIKALLLPQRRSAGLTGTVAKVSAGALASLPVVSISNIVKTLDALKKVGFWVVGLDGSAKQTHTDADLKRPLVVVVGSESDGIGRLVKEHCDFLVSIPMLGKTESLNASVAAGIFFYEVVRQNVSAPAAR